MSNIATAVMGLDIDSILVTKKIMDIKARMGEVAKNIIVPQLDVSQVYKQVDDMKRRMSAVFAKPIAMPKINIASSEKDLSKIKIAASIDAITDSTKKWQTSLSDVIKALDATGKESTRKFPAKDIAKTLRDASLSTLESRKKIVQDFAAITNEMKKMGASKSQMEALQKSTEFLNQLAPRAGRGGQAFGNIFGSFVGKVPISDLRSSVSQYQTILMGQSEAFSKIKDSFQTKTGTAHASQQQIIAPTATLTKALNTEITAAQAFVKTKPIVAELEVKPRTTYIALTNSLTAIEQKVRSWSASDFVNAFEWGQRVKAIKAEAEAVFSKEAVGRKIFSSLFNENQLAGSVGYFTGRLIDSVVGISRSLSDSILKLSTAVITSPLALLSRSNSIFGRVASWLKTGIDSIALVPRTALIGVFNSFHLIVNKYTLAIVTSLAFGINKMIFAAFRGIANIAISAAKSLFSKLKSVFGMFKFGGGAGGAGGLDEISNITFGLGFGAVAIRAAANLEEKMNAVATITNQSGSSLRRFTQDVIQSSNTFGKSAVEIASSLYDVASASFRGSDAMIALNQSLLSAQAGMSDASVSTAATVRILRSWSLPASEAATVSDVFFNTIKRGITTFPELAQQITQVTAVAATSGISFKEVGATLANLTRNGVRTEQAVTGLAGLFRSIVAPTEEGKKAVEALGIKWDESTIRSKGFVKVIKEIAPLILKNKEAFKNLVGDVQAFNAALKLAQFSSELDEDLASMNERGSAALAAARVATGFNHQLQVFWNNFLNIVRNIGQILLPLVEPALAKAVQFTQTIAQLANSDITTLLANIAKGFWNIFAQVSQVFGEVLMTVFSLYSKYRNAVIAIVVGTFNSVGRVLLKFLEAILTEFGIYLIEFTKAMAPIIWNGLNSILKEFLAVTDLLFERWFGKIWYDMKNGFGMVFEFLTKPMQIFMDSINWLWEWAFGKAEAIEKKAGEEATSSKLFDESIKRLTEHGKELSKTISDVPENFKTGFNKVADLDLSQFLPSLGKTNDKVREKIFEAMGEVGKAAIGAGNALFDNLGTNLDEQARGIEILIADLQKQYETETKTGMEDRAAITAQFISQEKERLSQINSQLSKSDLNEALENRQNLYIELVRAQKSQSIDTQKAIIEQIKNNEVIVKKLQTASLNAQSQASQISQNAQINSMDALKSRAMELVKAGQKAGESLSKLNEVLDDVFGRNVEQIAGKYGVGRETAALRGVTKDVIEAKAAGFSKEDLDLIVTRGLMQKSDSLTKIITAFTKTKQKLEVDNLKEIGVYDEIVKLLDRASALGLSEKARQDLLQKAVSEQAFKSLDKDTLQDKQTQFVDQAIKQFSGIEEERKLQERFNTAQLKLADLTKTAVTRNQVFKQTVEELEKKVVEIENLQRQQAQVQMTGNNP